MLLLNFYFIYIFLLKLQRGTITVFRFINNSNILIYNKAIKENYRALNISSNYNTMQLPTKETFETSPIELPQALENYGNPPYQNYTPQFGASGSICGVFQYTAPKARSQQINKPPTLTTPIEQCDF